MNRRKGERKKDKDSRNFKGMARKENGRQKADKGEGKGRRKCEYKT